MNPDTMPDFPHAKPEPEPKPVRPPYVHCRQPQAPGFRIGDRVRCTVGDCFIDEGTEGYVANVTPARYNRPAHARVLWDSDCASLIPDTDFEVVGKEEVA